MKIKRIRTAEPEGQCSWSAANVCYLGLTPKLEGPDGTPVSAIQSYQYHALTGNPTQYTDANGRVIRLNYDATGYDLLSAEIKNGATWDLLQSAGNYQNHQPRSFTDAQGQTTTVTYTAAGQVKTITNALNETTTLTYGTSTTDPLHPKDRIYQITGPQTGSTISLTYDTLERVRTVTDSSGYVTTYDYDVSIASLSSPIRTPPPSNSSMTG